MGEHEQGSRRSSAEVIAEQVLQEAQEAQAEREAQAAAEEQAPPRKRRRPTSAELIAKRAGVGPRV